MVNEATTQASPTQIFLLPWEQLAAVFPRTLPFFSTFHHVDDRGLTQGSRDPLLSGRKRTQRRTKLAYHRIR